ncbi:MAG: tetratricopeptide repeat-containing protein kinase family protein, partial [Planctomycetota bacterium]
EDSNVSKTGEVIGTLRFMAPEQFAGNPDPRSDVYSLGLTIYELLTLTPAWDETSRSHLLSGAHSNQTQIVAPMKLDSSIPRDLETIVMKACAREPEDRYQSAGELAQDLENFLEGQPIKARPPRAFEVFAKWCRRNPAIAGLSGFAALLLTLVAVTTSVGYLRIENAFRREQEERTRTEVAKREAEIEQQKAEQTLAVSLEALDRVYKRFAPDRVEASSSTTLEGLDGEQLTVSSQAMLSRETASLLEDVLSFYDQFAQQDTESALLKREAAKANRRVGDIHFQLGDYEKSIQAYDKSADMYKAIGDAKLEIARIQTALGDVFHEMQDEDLSKSSYIHAKRLLNESSQSDPDSPDVKYELARTLYRLSRRKRPDPERHRIEPRGDDFRGPPPLGGPLFGNRPPRFDGPGSPNGPPRPNDFSPERSQAIELLEELRSAWPDHPEYQFLLAMCYRDQRRPDQAGDGDTNAIELLEELCQQHPNVADYRFELAETLSRVPVHGKSLEKSSQFIGRLREAMSILDSLIVSHPNIPQYLKAKAHTLHKLGTLLKRISNDHNTSRREKLEEAIEALREAVEAQRAIHNQFPDSSADLLWLARMQENLAECLLQNNRPEKALDIIEQSIANVAAIPTNEDKDNRSAVLHTSIIQQRAYADILDRLKLKGEADAARKKANEFRQQLPPPPRRRRP